MNTLSNFTIELPTFSGKPNEPDFESFFRIYNLLTTGIKFKQHSQSALLISRLTGDARTYASSLPKDVLEDYASLLQALRDRFISKTDILRWEQQFSKIQQRSNESIAQFSQRFMELASKVNCPENKLAKKFLKRVREEIYLAYHKEQERITQILERIDPKLADGHAKQELKLEEILKQLMEIEATLPSTGVTNSISHSHKPNLNSQKRHHYRHQSQRHHRMPKTQPRQHQANQSRPSQSQVPRIRLPRRFHDLRTTDGRPVCGFCHRLGHTWFNCFRRQQHNNKQESSTSTPPPNPSSNAPSEQFAVSAVSTEPPPTTSTVSINRGPTTHVINVLTKMKNELDNDISSSLKSYKKSINTLLGPSSAFAAHYPLQQVITSGVNKTSRTDQLSHIISEQLLPLLSQPHSAD